MFENDAGVRATIVENEKTKFSPEIQPNNGNVFSSEDSLCLDKSLGDSSFPLTYSPLNTYQLKFSPLKSVLQTPEYLKNSQFLTTSIEDAENGDEKITLTPLTNVFSPGGTFSVSNSFPTHVLTKQEPAFESEQIDSMDFGSMDPFVVAPLPVFSTPVFGEAEICSSLRTADANVRISNAKNDVVHGHSLKNVQRLTITNHPLRPILSLVVIKPGQRFTSPLSIGTLVCSTESSSRTSFDERAPSPIPTPQPVPTPQAIPLPQLVQMLERPTVKTKPKKILPKINVKISQQSDISIKLQPKGRRAFPPMKHYLGPPNISLGRGGHSCQRCGQTFRYHSALREHILCVHTDNSMKPFYCYYCTKGFVRETRYNDHMLTHRGIKPYSCALCCIRFTSKDNAIKHVEICSGSKEYCCIHCGSVCPSHSSWYAHMNGSCPAAVSDRHREAAEKRQIIPKKASRKNCLPNYTKNSSFPRNFSQTSNKKTIIYLNNLSASNKSPIKNVATV